MRWQTFLIDSPTLLLFGLIFSFFESPKLSGSIFASRWFWQGIVFASLFNAAVVYAAFVAPDWMWMYFVESSRVTVLELIYILVFLYYVPFVLGFYLGLEARRFAGWIWLALVLLTVAANAWIIAHLFERYAVIGTRLQFYEETAPSLFGPDNPLHLVMNLSLGLMAVHFISVVWLWRRASKRRLREPSILL